MQWHQNVERKENSKISFAVTLNFADSQTRRRSVAHPFIISLPFPRPPVPVRTGLRLVPKADLLFLAQDYEALTFWVLFCQEKVPRPIRGYERNDDLLAGERY